MNTNRNGFDTLEQEIAGQVRAEMARYSILQHEMASAIGMHPNVFSRKYNGRTAFSLGELSHIARELGTTAERLTGEAERRYFEGVAA